MKFASDRPYADPEQAAHKIVEIANSTEAVQDGKIYIEQLLCKIRARKMRGYPMRGV